jgi:transcriptional regulator with XRE-family HTH domain
MGGRLGWIGVGKRVLLKDKLRSLRSGSKESLQHVADAIGVSKAHVWELEMGRSSNPSMEILKALAGHFKVTMAYLVEDEPLGEAKAQSFFRRNEGKLQQMTDDELAIIEGLVEKFTEKK